MPDKGIKPPNKRVEQLVTEIGRKLHNIHKGEIVLKVKSDKIATDAIKEAAYYKALCELYQKLIDESEG